jgi:hypothetical protein
MSLKSEHKLYIGLGVVALLGGLLYVQSTQKKQEAARLSGEARSASLPKLDLTEAKTKSVDKIEITTPDEDGKKGGKVVLTKQGEEWKVAEPVQAKADADNVKSLLENLPKIEVKEEIAAGTDQYEKYGVTDKKALHVVAFKGGEKLVDLYFGESGGRGQMTRIGGKDGVYSVTGYSSWAFKRELKNWRHREILKFEDAKVKTVELVNENGTFGFSKEGDKWVGKAKGPKDAAPKDIKEFDPSKVDDLVRAYKGLNADDFGDGKSADETGLATPVATLTFTLEDGAKRVALLGKNSEGENRWVRRQDSEQIFSVSSWAGNWATANVDKFTKKKDEKKDDKKPEEGAPDMGEMMPMEMPAGHP